MRTYSSKTSISCFASVIEGQNVHLLIAGILSRSAPRHWENTAVKYSSGYSTKQL